jgi:hypothetical protein
MVSNMTDSIDREVTPRQGRLKASAELWLSLAAAPTFAIMIHGGSMPDMLCSAAGNGFPLSGMVPMYLLMSAFHSRPWLKLVSGQRAAPALGLGGINE